MVKDPLDSPGTECSSAAGGSSLTGGGGGTSEFSSVEAFAALT